MIEERKVESISTFENYKRKATGKDVFFHINFFYLQSWSISITSTSTVLGYIQISSKTNIQCMKLKMYILILCLR